MKPVVFFVAMLLVLATSACGAGQPAEVRPPDIILGEDTCSDCGMSITDLRFAAAVVTPDGESFLFDDIADMLRYRQEHSLPEGTHYFVHDYDSREWLPADLAFYVRSETIHTPMGSGIAAFAVEARAAAEAEASGATVLDYDTLSAMPLTERSKMHNH